MLKLYICPDCKSTRYVSLENITCYRCSKNMLPADLPYASFIKLEKEERNTYIELFLKNQGPENPSVYPSGLLQKQTR